MDYFVVMEPVNTSSGEQISRWVRGAFVAGLIVGAVFGIIAFLVLIAILTVMIAPVQ